MHFKFRTLKGLYPATAFRGSVLCSLSFIKGLFVLVIHELYKPLAEQLGLERQKEKRASFTQNWNFQRNYIVFWQEREEKRAQTAFVIPPWEPGATPQRAPRFMQLEQMPLLWMEQDPRVILGDWLDFLHLPPKWIHSDWVIHRSPRRRRSSFSGRGRR